MRKLLVLAYGFERSWADFGLGNDELRELRNLFVANLDADDVIQKTGGAKKSATRGKQGKVRLCRIIYVDVVIRERVYLWLI